MLIFLIESLVICVLFTVVVFIGVSKKPAECINDWPPAVKARIKAENLFEVKDVRITKKEVLRKIFGCLIFVVIIGLLLKYVNKISTFWAGVFTSYGIWFIVDWWDAFVVDVICCKCRKVRIAGTETWDKEYNNLWFHIKMSFVGMGLGVPFALLVGLFVQFIG